MSGDREERVRHRAHELWEQGGRPEGQHDRYWEQASREVSAEGEPNLSTVAAGRMDAMGSPGTLLSPGAANSSRMSKARRKDAT